MSVQMYLASGKMRRANSPINITQVLLNVESTFENLLVTKIVLVLVTKIEPLTKQKSTGGVNQNASLKKRYNFIVAPLIFAKQRW